MNIAILGTKGIPAAYGGFETFAEELSVRLVQYGFSVTVFCHGDSASQMTSYRGVNLRYVSVPRIGPLTTELYDLLCIVNSLKQFDLVYMLGYGASMFYWLPRLVHIPIWVNMDGIEWKRAKWPWYGRLYLKFNEWCAVKFASLLIADAREIKKYFISRYGEAIACHVVPYGAYLVDTAPELKHIERVSLNPSAYYLVVCRLEPENHVLEIIDGFRRSTTSRKLIIVGDHTSGSQYCKSLLQSRDPRIFFIGTVYDQQALKALRYYAYAYFHGHSVGGTNPSLLEALGCGNVVIAHNNVFNHEVAGEVAYYFDGAADIPRLINTIEAISPQARMEKVRLAQATIRDIYDWDKIALRYKQLMDNL